MESGRELKGRHQQDPETTTFMVDVLIPASKLQEINAYLHASAAGEYQEKDSTIIYTAKFPDGKEMDIKCCGCEDDSSWTEAVLFTETGNELCFTEPGDTFQGQWKIKYGGVTYAADIKCDEEYCSNL